MKSNYHTHTQRCKHASGMEEEYIRSAMLMDYDVIGISDHCPWPKGPSRMRMEYRELNGYLDAVNQLKAAYADRITVKCGLECEYFPAQLQTLYAYYDDSRIDYLIFGNHYHLYEVNHLYFGRYVTNPDMLLKYADSACKGMDTKLFSCFAHPDLCFREWPHFEACAEEASRMICASAKKNQVVLEYNLGGVRMGSQHFPNHNFWEIVAQMGNEVIIGVDAHHPRDLLDTKSYQCAEKLLRELGIHMVDHLRMKGE